MIMPIFQQGINKLINRLFQILYGICLLILIFVAFQVFGFSTFKIPSDSMAPELESGDNILVFKPILGPRIFNILASLRNEQTAIYRLPGFRKVKRNDVLVFNFPCPNNWDTVEMHILKYYVKRCIGLPGDSLTIKEGLFFIHGYQGELGNKISQEAIRKRDKESFKDEGFNCFPYDSILNWDIKNFGPIYIPGAGDSVQMNRKNYLMYKKLIEWEQQCGLNYRDSSVYLDNKKIDTYQFLKDYYFMAGDNGENSEDSRYWGLVPEMFIVGKAWLIWKSVELHTNCLRWERIFKAVN